MKLDLSTLLLFGLIFVLFWNVSLFTYLLCIGLLTTIVFAIDKSAAIRHKRRVPEWKLLVLSFLGGAPFAVMIMSFLHHKTAKPSVYVPVYLFAILQVVAFFIFI